MRMAHGSGTSSRRHEGSLPSRSCGEPLDWEGKETLRLRELEEARARAAQMEKTMKWWSDCTANWREKWSKVRNERNKSREEAKQLRSKLDAALKDVSTYKREKQDLETLNEQMRKELERIHLVLLKHAGQWDNQLIEALDAAETEAPEQDEPERDGTDNDITDNDEGEQNGTERTLDGTEQDSNSLTTPDQIKTWPVTASPPTKDSTLETRIEKDFSQEKIITLQFKLEQANKSLLIEREEKAGVAANLERLQNEVTALRERCEELRVSRQDAVRELLALQDQHADTVALIRADLMDETTSREGMDRRLADLRAQVERLQGENAGEWGKREKVEAEKQAIERENKQLRADLLEIQERLDKKLRLSSPSDTSLLHQQISDKTKEVLELKHSERKLRKLVADKTSEAAHMTRRCEQYESEIRRLRVRVEDLKRDLAIAEEEIDSATNNIRKLQRTNDELQQQIEGLHVQVEGLHNRRSCVSSSSSNIEERISDQEIS